MTTVPTEKTKPTAISTNYARRVGRQFRGMSATERDELVADLAARLDAASASAYADLVEQFGTPEDYAREMGEALGVAPRRSHRRRWIIAAVTSIILVVGATLFLNRRPDISHYPIGFGSSSVPAGGVVEPVGSTLLVHVEATKVAELSVEIRNAGGTTVRVESLDRTVGVSANNDGGFDVSNEGLPPIWSPRIRVIRQADPTGVIITSFDDPTGFDFEPFNIGAGEHVLLSLRGPINYCVRAQGTVGDRLRLHVTISGQHRIIEGPELAFKFDDCP
jgi:hypothetical protein